MRARRYQLSAVAIALVSVSLSLTSAHPNRQSPPAEIERILDGLLLGAVTPTPLLNESGQLWLAWVENNHIFVGRSDDYGNTLTTKVRVTNTSETIDSNGEARPKIAIGKQNEIYVAWTRRGKLPYTGDIRFSRSTDSGLTFTTPITVNDDELPIGHRFESLGVNHRGEIFLVWIDKRDLESARSRGERYDGAALYYTWSQNNGQSFLPNKKIKDHVCECCRIALEFQDDGWPVFVWREILTGSIRDHGVIRFTGLHTFSEINKVNHDNWKIDGCPHHGPGFALDNDGQYHVVWFTGEGPDGPGAFYARSSDQGKSFTPARRVGSQSTFGHADIEVIGDKVYIVWKERVEDNAMGIFLMVSDDSGIQWSTPRLINKTSGRSDHPLLITDQTNIFLSWFTGDEGYQLTAITDSPIS